LLSHLRSYERYDEPETLPYSIRPFCPMSADVRQIASVNEVRQTTFYAHIGALRE
jgi:hypothetical protein